MAPCHCYLAWLATTTPDPSADDDPLIEPAAPDAPHRYQEPHRHQEQRHDKEPPISPSTPSRDEHAHTPAHPVLFSHSAHDEPTDRYRPAAPDEVDPARFLRAPFSTSSSEREHPKD